MEEINNRIRNNEIPHNFLMNGLLIQYQRLNNDLINKFNELIQFNGGKKKTKKHKSKRSRKTRKHNKK